MKNSSIEVLDTPVCSLGECPVWNGDEKSLFWTDIHGSILYRYLPDTGRIASQEMPDRLASFGFRQNRGVIGAFASGVALFDLPQMQLTWLTRLGDTDSRLRYNDGKTAPDGSFFVGTMDESCTEPLGGLWRLGTTGAPTLVVPDVCISNSLAWSPDCRTLYFTDSVTRRIDRYAFDPIDGSIGSRELHADLSDQCGVPDGSTVDREGGLWTALHGGSCLVRTLPDGSVDRMLSLPVKQPTCCTFGGEGLSTLYVTSAAENLPADPAAADGRLLRIETGFSGIPAAICAL